MMGTKQITIPYCEFDGLDNRALTSASEEQRWRAVNRLAQDNTILVPTAWNSSPLQAWCYLVLAVNELEPTPEPMPLTHWGIDLSFASAAVRQFVWFVS